jgi:hypothetical protein
MVHDCCDCLGAHQKVVFMTQEDIIALARKAGIAKYGLGWTCWEGQLERFATLVEERTHTKNKARWYQEGVEAEREACAKLAEEPYEFTSKEAHKIAASIRARANDVL